MGYPTFVNEALSLLSRRQKNDKELAQYHQKMFSTLQSSIEQNQLNQIGQKYNFFLREILSDNELQKELQNLSPNFNQLLNKGLPSQKNAYNDLHKALKTQEEKRKKGETFVKYLERLKKSGKITSFSEIESLMNTYLLNKKNKTNIGRALEDFLKTTGAVIINNLEQNNIENLLKQMEKNSNTQRLSETNVYLDKKEEPFFPPKTNNVSVKYNLGKNKVDVQIDIVDQKLNISAKNYSQSTVEKYGIKLFNGIYQTLLLSMPSNIAAGVLLKGTEQDISNKILSMHSAIGVNKKGLNLANVFVFNNRDAVINSNTNEKFYGIAFISMASLLKRALKNNLIEHSAKLIWIPYDNTNEILSSSIKYHLTPSGIQKILRTSYHLQAV